MLWALILFHGGVTVGLRGDSLQILINAGGNRNSVDSKTLVKSNSSQ